MVANESNINILLLKTHTEKKKQKKTHSFLKQDRSKVTSE